MRPAKLGIPAFVIVLTLLAPLQFRLAMSHYVFRAHNREITTRPSARALAPLAPTMSAEFRALILARPPMMVPVLVSRRVFTDSNVDMNVGTFAGTVETVTVAFNSSKLSRLMLCS